MKRFHAGVALLLSLLWEVRWAVGGALPCDSRGSPRGVRHRSRPGAERLAERSCSPHPAGRRAREVVYFAVNACAGAGLAPQAVRGQECGGAAGPGWAGRDPARLRCHGRSPCPGSCCWSRGRLSGVMEQNNAGPVRRGASCWKLPIPNRLADCPGDAKSAPVSTGYTEGASLIFILSGLSWAECPLRGRQRRAASSAHEEPWRHRAAWLNFWESLDGAAFLLRITK